MYTQGHTGKEGLNSGSLDLGMGSPQTEPGKAMESQCCLPGRNPAVICGGPGGLLTSGGQALEARGHTPTPTPTAGPDRALQDPAPGPSGSPEAEASSRGCGSDCEGGGPLYP